MPQYNTGYPNQYAARVKGTCCCPACMGYGFVIYGQRAVCLTCHGLGALGVSDADLWLRTHATADDRLSKHPTRLPHDEVGAEPAAEALALANLALAESLQVTHDWDEAVDAADAKAARDAKRAAWKRSGTKKTRSRASKDRKNALARQNRAKARGVAA